MASPSRTEPRVETPSFKVHTSPPRRSRRRWIVVLVLVAGLFVSGGIVILYTKIWPFSRASVLQDLSDASASAVTAQAFRQTYFPPGCILDGVVFTHGDRQFKLVTIDRLVIEGSYTGILRRHVPRITAVGAHVYIPRFGSNLKFDTQHSKTVVDEIIANGSYVEFAGAPGEEPLRFDIHEAKLNDVQWGSPISYRLKFRNPNPPGEILVDGKFGAWTTGHPEETPLSGAYKFDYADLGVYGGIGGTLSSQGKFEGKLKQVNVAGTTDVPDFVVESAGNKVRLQSSFDAYVDAIHGDTFLRHVDAHFGHTHLIVEGSIARDKRGKGKIAQLHFASRAGRIEDVLGLFVSDRSPMTGPMSLQTAVEISGGKTPFLQRVRLNGDFAINSGNFTKAETQKDVNELSEGASGKKMDDAETVPTDLGGSVNLQHGVSQFSDLVFSIPGAKARLRGTYNILNYRINLHGTMKVDSKISKTTSGMKSFILKVLDPVFKKKKHGEVVPIHILGTYEKPDFGVDIGGNEVSKQQ